MKHHLPATAALFLTLLAPLRISAHMAPTPLKSQINKRRPLLVFTPTPEDSRAVQQAALLHGHTAEIKERDIAVYILPLDMPHDASLTTQDAAAARTRFHIAPTAFTVILLGKDGGEKLRTTTPVTPDQLFQLIDAMPKRQQEMKNRAAPVK